MEGRESQGVNGYFGLISRVMRGKYFLPHLTLHPRAHSFLSSVQAFAPSGLPHPGCFQDISTSQVALFTLMLFRTLLFRNIVV